MTWTRPVSRSSSSSPSTATARTRSARRSRISCARAIRTGALRPGAQVPSTRDLARQLSISRRVAVEAYAQLAAEGYLSLRQGARPARVRDDRRRAAPNRRRRHARRPAAALRLPPQRPGRLRLPARRLAAVAARRAGHAHRRPPRLRRPVRRRAPLRTALADYLGRVRGVVADPGRVVVTNGFGQALGARLPRAGQRRREADRARGPEQHRSSTRSRNAPAWSPSRSASTSTACASTTLGDVDAVIITPAHQHPTGVVLSPRAARGAARLAARARRDRDRGRLRRRVPLRPRRRRRAPGARARPDRLRRLGVEDARARAAARLARRPDAPARADPPREVPRRPGHVADRAGRVRRLPRARRAGPPPAPHALALPRAPRRARRGDRGRAARGDGARDRRRAARHRRAPARLRRAGDQGPARERRIAFNVMADYSHARRARR